MARHFRRLILWSLAGIAALALLVACAIAWVWWFVDPDDYRERIEARAGAAIGRGVQLGRLRWQLGRQVYIVSEGGRIANAPGFGPEPLASWRRLRLGVALRPLLARRVLIDRVEADGASVLLQRNPQGASNWQLQLPATPGKPATRAVTLRIGAAVLRDSAIRLQDAATGADWRVSELDAGAELPADLAAADRHFQDIEVSGRLAGGPLVREGVAFTAQADRLQVSAQRLRIPGFSLRWAEAEAEGEVTALPRPVLDVTARLALQTPSLRESLRTVGISLAPMRDPAALGALELQMRVRHASGMLEISALSARMDGTQLTGELSLPTLHPPAARFSLVADRVNLDRYLAPADAGGDPFELPLARLKALDAQGTLRIAAVTVAGAAAKEVRIDVE